MIRRYWTRIVPSVLAAAIAVAALPLAQPAAAQGGYPDKPIRFVVCCTGFPEATARVIAAEITERSGVQIVVEAKPGANGILATEAVAKAPPDGYTVLIGSNSTHAANEVLYRKLPYDPVRDFAPLSGISQGTLLLAVRPTLSAKTVQELTALAKAEPGKLTYGWGSSSTRAAVELYKLHAGVKITDVPYRTNPQAAVDLLGGRIDLVISDLVSLKQHVDAGNLRALAVSSDQRAATLPDVPTMAEAGVSGYKLTFWIAAWMPAGTPPALVDRLNRIFTDAVRSPRVAEFLARGGSVPHATTPAELGAFQQAETRKWREIVTAAGIQPE
ncbi:MAG: Bug family tripartite tricarboxylate transporter substrate binding protein [Lautropia sp.]